MSLLGAARFSTFIIAALGNGRAALVGIDRTESAYAPLPIDLPPPPPPPSDEFRWNTRALRPAKPNYGLPFLIRHDEPLLRQLKPRKPGSAAYRRELRRKAKQRGRR